MKRDKDIELKGLLVRTLLETRFSMEDIDGLFGIIALEHGLTNHELESLWKKIGGEIETSIRSAKIKDLESRLSVLNEREVQDERAFAIIEAFKNECSKIIRLAVSYNSENTNYTTGVLGEIFAYLYARDIVQYECIHHKLEPDNTKTFRHGMDLLAVKFNESGQDEVHFIEAKATETNITSQRDAIVKWFTDEFALKANTVIDQAKRTWRNRYPPATFARAKLALSKFQAHLDEIAKSPSRYIGSILVDEQNSPSDQEIIGFQKLSFPRKQLVIIRTPCLKDLSVEVFELACKT